MGFGVRNEVAVDGERHLLSQCYHCDGRYRRKMGRRGNAMGLVQRLKETGSLRVGSGVRGGSGVGLKDDLAVARQSVAERGRGGDLHALLMRIWKEAELLVSSK